MGQNQKRGFKLETNLGEGWSSDNKAKTPKPTAKILHPDAHALFFRHEKRRGKSVTLVGPFYVADKPLKELAKKLKKRLGTGGSVKEEWMEFQGEVKQSLKEALLTCMA